MRINSALLSILVAGLFSPCQAFEAGVHEPLSFRYDNGRNLSTTFQHSTLQSRHSALSRFNGYEITRFSVHRSVGSSVLHYGATYADDEKHHYAGFSMGRATIAYFQGEGNSFSKGGSVLYKDLNHFFFHGGNHSSFGFQGAGLDFDLSKRVSTQFAGIRVKSPGLEDRLGYYAGLSAGALKGGVFGLERGNESIGHGFNFSFGGPRFGVEYQEIQNQFGAHLRRVGFSLGGNRKSRWSLSIEDAHNPLYTHADEKRVMFRYQRSFGRSVAFNATESSGETGEGEEAEDKEKKQEGFATVIGIGLGVGAIAVASNSGGGSDGMDRFATQNEAAFDVLNQINPVSVRENREHGGWVYRYVDGSFGHTTPIAGQVASVNLGNPVTSVPSGSSASATYHTHGGPDPRFDNENFSPVDLFSDRSLGVDGYLGTPAGFLKYHDVTNGSISTIGTINN